MNSDNVNNSVSATNNNNYTHNYKRILVTSALPYVNNVPHLGNLVCVISADVYTRFLRLMHRNVISVLGTDEHGTTSETKALEEGLTPKQLCDKYFELHTQIYKWFNCDFDCYGRTSSKENAEVTIDIFNKLYENGFISHGDMEQLYCENDKRFLADRFVEGTCPKCNYKNARGDQCENCGSLLNATELLDPRCKICKETPVIKKSIHLFIDLPKIEPKLREWMEGVECGWSDNALTMTRAWLREGLRSRCITRDLKWGIKVPLKGFEDKVFYSWFDAPIGYIGITKECKSDNDEWREWWLNNNNVKLVQFMGKDNIPFHTILFPSFLLGTGDNYTMMKDISVNEFLNYEGGQFSKSRGIGVFGDDARATGINADVFRYYLMINRPERTDTEFSWDDFQKKNNAELVANLGNLVNRTVVFLGRNFDSTVPEVRLDEKDRVLLEDIRIIEAKISRLVEQIALKDVLKEIMHISKLANAYLQDNEPWKNPDKQRNETTLSVLANIVKDLAVLVSPFMPSIANDIAGQLNIKRFDWDDLGKLTMHPGHRISSATPLFKKIEDKEIVGFRERFSGKKNKTGVERSHGASAAPITTAFDRLQLRVAKIVGVERHPNAEKLYIEKLDIGDEYRTIVSGLVPYYKEDELLGRKIIIVANLEPANLRGIESNGMLLAAEENGVVGLLTTQAEIGEYVYIRGTDDKKLETLRSLSKINIKEFASIKILVKDGKVFCDGSELMAGAKPLGVDMISNGNVR